MTHEHQFPQVKYRHISFCESRECGEIRVGTRRGKLRKLTTTELISVTAYMMEATCIAQAMQIVHGPERGMKRAREVLGYAEST